MYIKRHAVVRGQRRYVYLRLVQVYRDEHGRIRHRVLRTLGREDELKASGQLEQLMGSFARLDPPLAGVRREGGPLLLAALFIGELDLVGTLDRALLNDDRLGRGLEALAVYAEPLRGALAARAIERFGIDAGRLHADLTTLRVAGAYEHSALVVKGWGPDRRVARQVRALQATSACGVSIVRALGPRQRRRGHADRLLAGAAARALRAGGTARLRRRLRLTQDACADRAFEPALHRAAQGQHGLPRALRGRGRPRRAATNALRRQRQNDLPPARRTRYRGALRDWQITDPELGLRRRGSRHERLL
jgi:hypothetical protein